MEEQWSIDRYSELFQVEGQLSEEDSLFLEETSGFSTVRDVVGNISTPFRAKSKFAIGNPIVLPLANLLRRGGQKVPADIRLQLQHYEFYQVNLACSLQAAQGCRFHDASFTLDLQTILIDPKFPVLAPSAEAIAYDLFPVFLEDECKVNLKHNLDFEVNLGFDPAALHLKLPVLHERSEEFVVYKSRIMAFGLQGRQPGWNFKRTALHEIESSQRLFMILRKPKGTHVQVTFKLEARVQFILAGVGLDLWPLTMIFRRSASDNHIVETPSTPLDILL